MKGAGGGGRNPAVLILEVFPLFICPVLEMQIVPISNWIAGDDQQNPTYRS